jgi:hypothetical protein
MQFSAFFASILFLTLGFKNLPETLFGRNCLVKSTPGADVMLLKNIFAVKIGVYCTKYCQLCQN